MKNNKSDVLIDCTSFNKIINNLMFVVNLKCDIILNICSYMAIVFFCFKNILSLRDSNFIPRKLL